MRLPLQFRHYLALALLLLLALAVRSNSSSSTGAVTGAPTAAAGPPLAGTR